MTVPLIQTAAWTKLNPDMWVMTSLDPSAAAENVTVASLPAVGEQIVTQINFDGDQGGVGQLHTVVAGDTVVTVAKSLCDQINAHALLDSHGIGAQWTPETGVFGVSHRLDNLATVSAQVHPECVVIRHGARILDAGGIMAMNRLPTGLVPPNGSCIAYMAYGSARAGHPDVASEYASVAVFVRNSDPSNLAGEIAFYTTETRNGSPYNAKRMSVSNEGLRLGETDVPLGVWRNYSANVSGDISPIAATVDARYTMLGLKTCAVSMMITVTDGGQGNTYLAVDLPMRCVTTGMFFGRYHQHDGGRALQAWVGAPTRMSIVDINDQYPGPPPGVTGTLIVSGIYEID